MGNTIELPILQISVKSLIAIWPTINFFFGIIMEELINSSHLNQFKTLRTVQSQ
jgi:hypothetical protein